MTFSIPKNKCYPFAGSAIAAAAVVFLSVGSAKATLLDVIPPNLNQAILDQDAGGLFTANGAVVGNLTSPFDVTNLGTHIKGTIETYVVRRTLNNTPQGNDHAASPGLPLGPGAYPSNYAALGLDFYYQIKLDPTSAANADIRAVTLSIFDPSSLTGSGQISAFDIVTAGNVPGVLESIGNQAALFVSRDSAGVKFDFRSPTGAVDNSLVNVAGQRDSNWLVLRTNSTIFDVGNGALIDGIAFNAPILAPGIPEPSTMLVGFALLGVVLKGRGRTRMGNCAS